MRLVKAAVPLALMVLLLSTTACVHTELNSLPSPQGHVLPLRRVVVIVDVLDIGIRVDAENAAVPQMPQNFVCSNSPHSTAAPGAPDPYFTTGKTVSGSTASVSPTTVATAVASTQWSCSDVPTLFLPSYRFLPPLDQWQQTPAQQKDSILAADSVDAVMIVDPTGSGLTEEDYTQTRTACTSTDLNTGSCRSTRSTSTTTAITKPWMSTFIRLISTSDKKTLWTGTASSGGGMTVQFHSLAESIVANAVAKMRADGLIK